MDVTRYAQNFGHCQLNDQRLNSRALKIGEALTQKFGT
jgi:hypothetical protein